MHLPFFISLATALVALYICKNSADEISYLAAAIVAASLLLTLIFAPWQLQILLLISVWFSKRLFLPFPRTQVELKTSDIPESEVNENLAIAQSQSLQVTKLAYRGVSYQSNSPALPEIKDKIIGKYRGQVCQTSQLENTTLPASSLNLKYRGVCLNSNPSPTEAAPTTSKVKKGMGIKTATRKGGSRGIVLVRPVLFPSQN
jgi:hypothetical protein